METINECNRMKEYKLPEQINIPQTIILADGDFPSSSLAKEWLRECPYVVCCDGAVNTYLRFGKMPAAIVGDGDSLLPEIKERYVHLIHHTLGNISLLADYMEQAEVRMLTDYGLFIPIKEDSVFESFPTQQVSVFNMGATELSADGLVYPLSAFTNWWQGTLNEAIGNRFIIHVHGKVLVFRVI